ncbi:hypothetical protein PB1_05130 [Bacillus methanolicus PB1]|uniref:DUF3990 domain-containing protein n=1 Tax=Bacillus methanolicus PB1 TaxID=997296 RepID=I3E715_BACMT|nr:hypothetical protein [Bacillus methanolicus]EIJ82286.1 hypothetical protein PB1_05130 [Bacillus methanolicus PB1]
MSIISPSDFPVYLSLFHGTTESVAKDIVAHKNFKIGEFREDHWLGQGVYFYREDYKQALIWARYKIKRKKELNGENVAVIYSNTIINNSQFLNLDTREGLNFFKSFLEGLKAFSGENKIEINIDDDHPKKKELLMCFYCDMLPKEIKVIQRTYRVGSGHFDSDTLLQEVGMHLHGIQVCVRDTSVIDYEKTGIWSIAKAHSKPLKKKKKRKISFEEE